MRGGRLCTWHSHASGIPSEELILSHYVCAVTDFCHNKLCRQSSLTNLDVFAQIFDLFDDWAIFVGMLTGSTPKSESMQWMDIQLPIRDMFCSLLHGVHGQDVRLVSTGPAVRLCCASIPQLHREWSQGKQSLLQSFDLSPKLSDRLFKLLSQQTVTRMVYLMFAGPLADFHSLTEMILDEIWEDPHNQLTAWGRLYCRACFRQCFRHYWRYE